MKILNDIFKKTVWIAERVTISNGEPISGEIIGVAKDRAMACALLHREGFIRGDYETLTSDLGVKKLKYLFKDTAGNYAQVREVHLY